MIEIERIISVKKCAAVVAGQSSAVDSLPLSCFGRAEYTVHIQSGTKELSFNVSVGKSDTELSWEIYGIMGCMDVELEFNESNASALMEVTNNEIDDLKVNLTRTTT